MSSLINFSVTQSTKQQQGFTLLELVLVMLIIGLVASTPLVFIDNQDNQFRYEETLKKLELIERAVFQPQNYRDEPVLTGFIVDNGVLPPASSTATQSVDELKPLISKDGSWNTDPSGDWADYGLLNPFLFSGTASEAVISTHPQLKGYRANYLSDGLDSSQEFLDSWGIPFEVSSSGATYTFAYKGDDGAHPAAYNSAVSESVRDSDWTIPLNQLDIQLTNNHATETHQIAVVVFENVATTDEADRWTTYHFSATASSAEHSLSFTTGQWTENGSVINAASTAVPAGQHPVFVLDSSDTVQDYDRLLVIPGATQPSLQFEVD